RFQCPRRTVFSARASRPAARLSAGTPGQVSARVQAPPIRGCFPTGGGHPPRVLGTDGPTLRHLRDALLSLAFGGNVRGASTQEGDLVSKLDPTASDVMRL